MTVLSFPSPSRAARRALGVAAVSAAALLGAVPAAGAFSLGFNSEDLTLQAGSYGNPVNEANLMAGLTGGASAGARTWRFQLRWRDVAAGSQTAPIPATLAADPNWSGYRWDVTDRMIRSITAAGMEPLPWAARAPAWAEGPNRPSDRKLYPGGTWRPSPTQFGQFAVALAKRYSGTWPDPQRPGQTLPRVKTWQAWNEPNLYTEINPQWEKVKGRQKIASVGIYRQLLNRFYRGIKSVQPDAVVLSAGTAPFGGLYAGEPRIQPARFYRELFCMTERRGKLTARRSCVKPRFDGWAHHTYPIGPPTRTARNDDDVVVPDMPKLTRIMRAAVKAKLVSSKASKEVWITEMSWETAPDPNGLSLGEHAAYMQGAFYVLWKAGVKRVLWWNSRDDAERGDWNATYQSGIFFRGATPAQDTPKPAFTAFRFPFAAYRTRGVAALWTKMPGTGPVKVQAQGLGGDWTDVATLTPRADGTATGRLRVGTATNLRAVQGAEVSLPWRTF